MTIKDFKCAYYSTNVISNEIARIADVSFPAVHTDAAASAHLSQTLKDHVGSAFCVLPFCHTVEAEALGADINYGDESFGPRCNSYVLNSVEQVLYLPEIDFKQGRVATVLEACRTLTNQGQDVMMEICGPITIMSYLMDPKIIFKTLRKDKNLMAQVCEKLGKQILRFAQEAKKAGARLISYNDVVGNVNILGPKLAESMIDLFTHDFAERLQSLSDEKCLMILCPKTSYALVGAGKAEFREVQLSGTMSYGDACLDAIGKVRLAGMQCYKNVSFIVQNGRFMELYLI